MKRWIILAGAWIAMSIAPLAQMEPPKPGPEHKKMEMMLGSWAMEGDVKPNPPYPGGKFTESEKCDWMDGGFFMVCHVDFKSANMGSATGMSVLGYSSDEKSYSYLEFNSWGEAMKSKGTVDGNTWTWLGDEKKDSGVVKGRFTMKFTSPTAYTFSYEQSPDGSNWTTLMEGKATKEK